MIVILCGIGKSELIGRIEKEIILVNDCSTDTTEDAVHTYIQANPELSISYYKHPYNQGKGAAIQLGLRTDEFEENSRSNSKDVTLRYESQRPFLDYKDVYNTKSKVLGWLVYMCVQHLP